MCNSSAISIEIEIKIKSNLSYDTVIGADILSDLPQKLSELFPQGKALLLTDSNVDKLWGQKLLKALKEQNTDCSYMVFPRGEESKSESTLKAILSFMAEKNFTREDYLIALGGGVTGDIGGLAAALYMRGISVVQVPTTLLAMTDAAIGGKTAINFGGAKNSIGVFHQPSLVWEDTATLETLPETYFTDGMAEVLKYGFIAGEELLNMLAAEDYRNRLGEIIGCCVKSKKRYIQEDCLDKGERRLLNFGHTIGHAIEAYTDYDISHGRAVAMGMAHMARAAACNNLCSPEDRDRIISLLQKHKLPTELPEGITINKLVPLILRDKKNKGDTVIFVIPESYGKCRLVPVETDRLYDFLNI